MAKNDRPKDYQDFIDFFDPMIEGFVGAVDDIRHKFEEVFYGREVTGDILQGDHRHDPSEDVLSEFYGWPKQDAGGNRSSGDAPSFAEEISAVFGSKKLEPALDKPDREPEREIEPPDHGMDF